MTYFYSPATGELINTDTPAPWMGSTELAPPGFDATTEGAFFINGAWSVVAATPALVLVPASVTPRQIRQALTAAGLRAQVEAAVAAGGQYLKDWWEFSTSVNRDHPAVLAMGASLGVSSAQLDALFTVAAGL